jgi:ubiquinone/menaquinone biosynthesis C-methylase UbiE
MSLMDIPETEHAFAEIFRVLRPDGFLQFSISHPCFETPHRETPHRETPHRKTLRDQRRARLRARSGRLFSEVGR